MAVKYAFYQSAFYAINMRFERGYWYCTLSRQRKEMKALAMANLDLLCWKIEGGAQAVLIHMLRMSTKHSIYSQAI